jgi:hypothetical protein
MLQGFPMVSQCCSTILQMIYSSTIEMFAGIKPNASAGAGAAACEKKPFAENHGDKKC